MFKSFNYLHCVPSFSIYVFLSLFLLPHGCKIAATAEGMESLHAYENGQIFKSFPFTELEEAHLNILQSFPKDLLLV